MKSLIISALSLLMMSNIAFAAKEYSLSEYTINHSDPSTFKNVPENLKKSWPDIKPSEFRNYSFFYFTDFDANGAEYNFSAFTENNEVCDSGPQGSMVTEDHPLRCIVRLLNTKTGDVKKIDNVCIEIHYGGDVSKLITKLSIDEEKKTARIINETKVFGGGPCTNVFTLN